jgi:hypothetical protein
VVKADRALQYGMEEAAGYPVPDGKYAKVACATRACPGLSSSRGVVGLSDPYRCGPPHPEPIYYCATGDEMPLFEPCKEMKGQRDV